ncbi:winged helix-turn-helix domain-containing protein [Allokutzneria sp. A3M-2-11 16]|uniref:ArsR/SmtB family transcription factor n=1 Tax=Allokutzneria sp. A3M-2-11 16 TaxID=2962043 RepID=UPI0020B88F6C|nr:winged helix-turn-helix domain-containing protein [Allokutzneria sp. A3M-2-11 16]MCP3803803.1 winged helix-turn-helix domain-containing protein [Allokutzneria sp. A3M-2-11 16]
MSAPAAASAASAASSTEPQRIRFGVQDIARVRILATLGPTAEAVFALDALSRSKRGDRFGAWGQKVVAALGPRWGQVCALVDAVRPIPDLLWLINPSGGGTAPTRVGGVSAAEAASVVRTFARLVVEPHWNRMRLFLDAERDARGRIAAAGGSDRLLGTLHPHLRWSSPVLETRAEGCEEVRLDGQGLALVPSVFLHDRVAVLAGSECGSGSPMLVFPAVRDATAAASLWGGDTGEEEALGALVGRTRSLVLQELTESRTATELAQRLGISNARVSQHTGVLRQAGLINTLRYRNTVLHSLTALGTALLGGKAFDMAECAPILSARATGD